ncbi:MAG: hypothetical protein Q8O81_13935 [Giesbergeria sp.]|nr:hypothetical protein [Giesbergeria sp.]
MEVSQSLMMRLTLPMQATRGPIETQPATSIGAASTHLERDFAKVTQPLMVTARTAHPFTAITETG